MKKTLLNCSLILLIAASSWAQQRSDGQGAAIISESAVKTNESTITGSVLSRSVAHHSVADRGGCPDVLLFEDFQSQAIPGTWINLDLDGNTDANARPMDWFVDFDAQTTTAGDTNWVAQSSSWFTPFAVANNWLILDPVTICAGDIILSWWSAPFEGPAFLDGYRVLLSPTGGSATSDFTVELAHFAEGDAAGNVGPGIAHTSYVGNNGILQRWTVDLASYFGSSVRIAFVHDSDDDNLIMIDDIFIGKDIAFDLAVNNTFSGTEYPIVPTSQVRPITPSAQIENLGLADVTNSGMTFTVMDEGPATVFTQSETVGALPGGAFQNVVSSASFTPPAVVQNYTIEATASADETDPDLSNNVGSDFVSVTDTVFARELGTVTGALSIGAGNSGFLCNEFELVAPDYISSISAYFTAPTVGDTLIARIFDMSGGSPSSIIASSDTIFITSADDSLYNFMMEGGPFMLSAGTYVVCIEESVSGSATVGTTTNHFVPGSTWVFFGGNWGNSEDFGFSIAYVIRLNVTANPPTGVSTVETSEIKLYPNPSNGNFVIEIQAQEGPATLMITDMIGRNVYTEAVSLNQHFRKNVDASLAKGTYLLSVVSETQRLVGKIQIN